MNRALWALVGAVDHGGSAMTTPRRSPTNVRMPDLLHGANIALHFRRLEEERAMTRERRRRRWIGWWRPGDRVTEVTT